MNAVKAIILDLLYIRWLIYNIPCITFKLIIWWNALIVYLYVFVLYLYEKKLELISVITFIITLLTHPVHLNPPLTQPYYQTCP